MRAIPLALIGGEEAAELRFDAKKREEILRDRNAGEALGFAASTRKLVVADAVECEIGGHIGERLILFAQVEKMADLHSLAGEAKCTGTVRDPDEAGGIVEGKRRIGGY